MFNKNRKALERIFPSKQQKTSSRVKKIAITVAALMGIGAAITKAAKEGDQR